MDIYYLKDHMFEEVSGAKDYMRKAIYLKQKHPDRSKQFYDMANMELEHARALYKMFCEDYKQINSDPALEAYMEPFKKSADDCFMEKIGTVKYMQETYTK